MSSIKFNENDTVAILDDIPSSDLKKGDVGTVVAILSKDILEVEFIDKKGVTLAIIPINKANLMKLRLNLVTP